MRGKKNSKLNAASITKVTEDMGRFTGEVLSHELLQLPFASQRFTSTGHWLKAPVGLDKYKSAKQYNVFSS